jgi:hypothetical protein
MTSLKASEASEDDERPRLMPASFGPVVTTAGRSAQTDRRRFQNTFISRLTAKRKACDNLASVLTTSQQRSLKINSR